MHSGEAGVGTSWKTPKPSAFGNLGAVCPVKAKGHASDKSGKGLEGKGKW